MVTDGVLRSSASYLQALGFLEDGSAIIGTPNLDLKANFKGIPKIADINKIRTNTGFYIFTDDFASTTRNTQAGVDVILTPNTPGEELKIGSTLSCTVGQVIEATGATTIPQGKLILSISNQSGEWLQEVIRSLAPGDSVDISITAPDTRWEDVTYAVGACTDSEGRGGGHLLSDGAAAPHRRGHQAQRRGGLLHHRRPPGRPQRGRHHSNGGPAAERAGPAPTPSF